MHSFLRKIYRLCFFTLNLMFHGTTAWTHSVHFIIYKDKVRHLLKKKKDIRTILILGWEIQNCRLKLIKKKVVINVVITYLIFSNLIKIGTVLI